MAALPSAGVSSSVLGGAVFAVPPLAVFAARFAPVFAGADPEVQAPVKAAKKLKNVIVSTVIFFIYPLYFSSLSFLESASVRAGVLEGIPSISDFSSFARSIWFGFIFVSGRTEVLPGAKPAAGKVMPMAVSSSVKAL